MAEAGESGGGQVPLAMRRLDRAIADLEAMIAGLDAEPATDIDTDAVAAANGAPANATEAAAEVKRLRALHEAVAQRLDAAIARLRVLVGE